MLVLNSLAQSFKACFFRGWSKKLARPAGKIAQTRFSNYELYLAWGCIVIGCLQGWSLHWSFFRSARTSCRTFDFRPVHPSCPVRNNCSWVHRWAEALLSGTPKTVYFLKVHDVSYPNSDENTNTKTNTETNTKTNKKTETNKGKTWDTYES